MLIKLEPQPKKDGVYTFHDGYQFRSYTNFRKYKKELKRHEIFLNSLVRLKYRKVLEAVMDHDLESIHKLTGELIRLKVQLRRQGGYSGLVHINNLLIPRMDE